MIIVMDCETGGTNPNLHSLLSMYLGVFTNNLKEQVDELNLLIQHNQYIIEPQALIVNKINLVEHHKVGLPMSVCQEKVDYLMERWSSPDLKATPLGHNTDFDLSFGESNFGIKSKMSHRKLCTSTVGRFLKMCRLIPEECSGLDQYAAFFGITPQGNLHEARTDALLTVDIFKAMLTLVKEKDWKILD